MCYMVLIYSSLGQKLIPKKKEYEEEDDDDIDVEENRGDNDNDKDIDTKKNDRGSVTPQEGT